MTADLAAALALTLAGLILYALGWCRGVRDGDDDRHRLIRRLCRAERTIAEMQGQLDDAPDGDLWVEFERQEGT